MILGNTAYFFKHFCCFFIMNVVISNFTFKYEQGSFTTEAKSNRVRRGEWRYPTVTIMETIEGTLFSTRTLMTVKSSNPNTVKYELLDNSIGVRAGYFVIENLEGKGVIRQIKAIDREMYPTFIITARALDANNQNTESDTEIEIIIVDENDNEPIFVPTSMTGSVLESASVGQAFMQISATDADLSFYDYNKVRFAYVWNEHPPKADGSNRFSVSHSGQVSIVSSLDREADGEIITFLVKAMDGLQETGVLRHSTTGTVTVTIMDANDNVPFFTKNVYRKSIGELTRVGTTIMTLQADDNDEGVNKGVYFYISSGNINQQFSIQSDPNFATGSSLGNVILEKPLDFDNGPRFFILNITAYNKDALSNIDSLTATASVQINITDENEPPIFIYESYSGFVMENIENGVRNVSKVTALDFDFDKNQTISYALESALSWFEIDEVSGEILTVTAVDREHVSVDQDTSQYLLRVTANDDGDPKLTSTATVTITIGDKNDNAPAKGDGWNVTMCKNPPYAVRENTSILNIKDYDSILFASFSFKKLESKDWSYFDLKNGSKTDNAQLVIQQTMNDYVFEKNLYELPIQLVNTATNDQLAHTSTQTVSIQICQCNDYDAQPICNDDVVSPDDDITIILIIIISIILLFMMVVFAAVAYKHQSRNKLNQKKKINKKNDMETDVKADDDNNRENILLLQGTRLSSSNKQDVLPHGVGAPLLRKNSQVLTDAKYSVTEVAVNEMYKQSKFPMQQIVSSSQDIQHEATLPAHENGNITSYKLLNIQTSLMAEETKAETKSVNLNFDANSFLTSSDDADVVGVGGYGVVRRCVHSVLGKVVVKCMHCEPKDGLGSKIAEARKRVQVFTRFNHKHIVRFHGSTSWGNCFGIVMEEIKCGNLHDLMIGNKQVNVIDWRLRFRIIFQLAHALKYLHCHDPNKSYIHLDIKPENILMTTKFCVKLADFGALDMAKATGINPTTTTTTGINANQYTVWYTAPERLRNLFGKASSSMDVYSFAMICYEVITRKEVFGDVKVSPNLVRELIVAQGQKPNPKLISDVEQKLKQKKSVKDFDKFQTLKVIMEKCWCFKPKDRLSITQVCKTLTEFAGSDNPYEVELRSHIDYLAKDLLLGQKLTATLEQKVPLQFHSPPFQHVMIIDGTSSATNETLSSQIEKVNINKHMKVTLPKNKPKQSELEISSSFQKHKTVKPKKYDNQEPRIPEKLMRPISSSSRDGEAAISVPKKEQKSSNKQLSVTTILDKQANEATLSTNLNFDASSFLTSNNQVDIVGFGGYGVVRRCAHSVLGRVVVKCMHCGESDDLDSKIAETRKRVQVFTRFDHEHIVRFHGLTSWGNCFGMVMEEIKCGNLHDLMIGNKKIKTIDWKLRFRIIFQLANALKYLHCHNVKKSYVHLDIKPENILMTTKLCVKLADFGALDIVIATDASTTTDIFGAMQLTPLYTAPERLKDKTKVSSSMDVYSFALICYEVITRQRVFSNAAVDALYLISELATRGIKPNMKSISDVEQTLKQESLKNFEIFETFKIIMEKCWCFESNDRLSMNEVCKMLVEFAGCDDPYEAELKNHVDNVANIILRDQKPFSTSEQKVPLNCHEPPFSIRLPR